MRRLGLFAGFLLLLGLTTAVAASFDVQAEDITSFSTEVDISVPGPPGMTGFYLRGENDVIPGILDPNPDPAANDPVRTAEILPGTSNVQSQTDPNRYHSWQTLTGDLVLDGPVRLHIFQGGASDRVSAGLFRCGLDATPTAELCDQIAPDATNPGDEGGGISTVRIVDFGTVQAVIGPDERLRVQIANLPPVSTKKWSVQWGYKSNRPSLLDVTLATP